MENKVGYSFGSLLLHHRELVDERNQIVSNLALPIQRDSEVTMSLVEDLKIINQKIEDFERRVVWTENIFTTPSNQSS